MIGRRTESEHLAGFVEQIKERRGTAVLLSGDSGIGKSRLARSAIEFGLANGCIVLEGHCFETTRALAFGPILDLLRSFCSGRSPDEIIRFFGTTLVELVKILPELATILPDLAPAPPFDPVQHKNQIFEELVRLFVRIASVSPLLILIEDLHWCDETTTEFLLTLSFRISNQPILLMLTCSRALAPNYVDHLLLRLDRESLVRIISLAPMTRDETDHMLRAIFDLPRPIRPEFLESIYGLTEGNPAFIEETAKSLIAAGKTVFSDETWDRRHEIPLPIPPGARETARDQTRRLSPIARQLLNLAAVIGRRFNFAFLQYLVQRDERELLQDLKELVAAQLVVENSAEEFSFRNVVTRRAIYSELMARERKSLHLDIANALERKADQQGGVELAELAFHFYDAQQWDKALMYSAQAGKAALDSHSPRSALRHYTRALMAADHLSTSPPLDVVRSRGLAYQELGDFEAAREDFDRALRMTNSGEELAQHVRLLLDLAAIWGPRDSMLAAGYDSQAFELAANISHPVLSAAALNHIGTRLVGSDEPFRATEMHRRALTLADESGDLSSRLAALKGLGLAHYMLGDRSGAVGHLTQAFELANQLHDQVSLVSTSALLCESRVESAKMLPSEGEIAVRTARQISWRSGLSMALLSMSAFLARTGDYSRALQFAQDGLNVAEEIEHRLWIAAAYFAQGQVLADLHQSDLAKPVLEQARKLAVEIHSTVWMRHATAFLAYILVLQKDFANAQSLLDSCDSKLQICPPHRVVSLDDSLDSQSSEGQRLVAWARAELALAQGEPLGAIQVASPFIRAGGPFESRSRLLISRVLANAYLAIGDLAPAGEFVRAAIAAAVLQLNRPLEWQLRVISGKVWMSLEREKEAREEFALARSIVDEIASRIEDSRLREYFVRAAHSSIPSIQIGSQAKLEYDGLTRREVEVAAHVAAGETNRQIGNCLSITERTVKTHIANIMNKLGFDNRSQIASWASEKRLTLE